MRTIPLPVVTAVLVVLLLVPLSVPDPAAAHRPDPSKTQAIGTAVRFHKIIPQLTTNVLDGPDQFEQEFVFLFEPTWDKHPDLAPATNERTATLTRPYIEETRSVKSWFGPFSWTKTATTFTAADAFYVRDVNGWSTGIITDKPITAPGPLGTGGNKPTVGVGATGFHDVPFSVMNLFHHPECADREQLHLKVSAWEVDYDGWAQVNKVLGGVIAVGGLATGIGGLSSGGIVLAGGTITVSSGAIAVAGVVIAVAGVVLLIADLVLDSLGARDSYGDARRFLPDDKHETFELSGEDGKVVLDLSAIPKVSAPAVQARCAAGGSGTSTGVSPPGTRGTVGGGEGPAKEEPRDPPALDDPRRGPQPVPFGALPATGPFFDDMQEGYALAVAGLPEPTNPAGLSERSVELLRTLQADAALAGGELVAHGAFATTDGADPAQLAEARLAATTDRPNALAMFRSLVSGLAGQPAGGGDAAALGWTPVPRNPVWVPGSGLPATMLVGAAGESLPALAVGGSEQGFVLTAPGAGPPEGAMGLVDVWIAPAFEPCEDPLLLGSGRCLPDGPLDVHAVCLALAPDAPVDRETLHIVGDAQARARFGRAICSETPPAGEVRTLFLPEVGDEVLVGFESAPVSTLAGLLAEARLHVAMNPTLDLAVPIALAVQGGEEAPMEVPSPEDTFLGWAQEKAMIYNAALEEDRVPGWVGRLTQGTVLVEPFFPGWGPGSYAVRFEDRRVVAIEPVEGDAPARTIVRGDVNTFYAIAAADNVGDRLGLALATGELEVEGDGSGLAPVLARALVRMGEDPWALAPGETSLRETGIHLEGVDGWLAGGPTGPATLLRNPFGHRVVLPGGDGPLRGLTGSPLWGVGADEVGYVLGGTGAPVGYTTVGMQDLLGAPAPQGYTPMTGRAGVIPWAPGLVVFGGGAGGSGGGSGIAVGGS